MNRNVEINCMSWQEYSKAVKEKPLIIPIGSLEQHGPHLPLGVDAFISHGFAVRVAEAVGAIVAPQIHYGYKSLPASGGGHLFPGASLNASTLINLVVDILCEVIEDGAKNIFIMNGHFENDAFLLEAIDLAIKRYEKGTIKICMGSWYDQIEQEVLDAVFDEVPFPGWALEHAAIAETSIMMYFHPELVHLDRATDEGIETPPTYHTYPVPKNMVPCSGQLHTPLTSTPEKGELMVNSVVKAFKEIFKKEFDK